MIPVCINLLNAVAIETMLLLVVLAWITWGILGESKQSGAPYWHDSSTVICCLFLVDFFFNFCL